MYFSVATDLFVHYLLDTDNGFILHEYRPSEF